MRKLFRRFINLFRRKKLYYKAMTQNIVAVIVGIIIYKRLVAPLINEQDALNKTLIKDSDFSVRLKNCLLAMDLVTFSDVTNYYRTCDLWDYRSHWDKENWDENKFLKFRNFGKMSLQELKESGLLTKE